VINNQGSISSTFNEQLLHAQNPNAQKRQSCQQCRLALLGPTSVKAARKALVKLIPGCRFNEMVLVTIQGLFFIRTGPAKVAA